MTKFKPDDTISVPTLQHVLDTVEAHPTLGDGRKRDLRSALRTVAKLADKPLATIPLNLEAVREIVDRATDHPHRVSKKRAANLRSDISSAIELFNPTLIIRTNKLRLNDDWALILHGVERFGDRTALSRFARWASLKNIKPKDVRELTIAEYVNAMNDRMLARTTKTSKGQLVRTWNTVAAANGQLNLLAIAQPPRALVRIAWKDLPSAFQNDVAEYLRWCQVPDVFDEAARKTALSPQTIRLRKEQIHSAISAAIEAGIEPARLNCLADLVDAECFKTLFRQRLLKDNKTLSAYTHGIAGALIEIARQWVKLPDDKIQELKRLRSKLGTLRTGLTQKNTDTLRQFDDERLVRKLVRLPDRLWSRAKKGLSISKNSLIDMQTALAIDVLLHSSLRMKNLTSVSFSTHLNRPNGPGTAALLYIPPAESKNREAISMELPVYLSERLWQFRDLFHQTVGGQIDRLFSATVGRPRTQSAVALSIKRTIRDELGIDLTGHQFRHLAAKLILDQNPGAYELARQFLGHKNLKTTTDYYAGIDTKRAGRAQAALLLELAGRARSVRRRRAEP